MNLNPFVFSYKRYPNSKLATMVSHLCNYMQRFFLIAVVIMICIIIFVDVANMGEALIATAAMLALWFLLRKKKDEWCDKIAAKQESIDDTNEE